MVSTRDYYVRTSHCVVYVYCNTFPKKTGVANTKTYNNETNVSCMGITNAYILYIRTHCVYSVHVFYCMCDIQTTTDTMYLSILFYSM